MRLVWRAAIAFAEQGWPVMPWDSGALEPFASADVAQVTGWAGQYASSNAMVDLVAAGMLVVEVTGDAGFASLVDLFDKAQEWPSDGVLTLSVPDGWLWHVWQPDPPLRPGGIAEGVRVLTQYSVVPGGAINGGVARLEVVGDLAASPCPQWLAAVARV